MELSIRDQSLSLYIVPNVPEDFPFETRTRKEISVSRRAAVMNINTKELFQKIAWFRLTDLPTWRRNKAVPGKFYLITPFIGYVYSLLLIIIVTERHSGHLRHSSERGSQKIIVDLAGDLMLLWNPIRICLAVMMGIRKLMYSMLRTLPRSLARSRLPILVILRHHRRSTVSRLCILPLATTRLTPSKL